MITLSSTGTLKGKAGTATAVTYTISGDSLTTTDAFQILGQGQLGTTTADLLTTTPVPASTTYLIKNILLTNTTSSPVTGIVLYVNGTAATNQIVQISLVANGSAVYDNGLWQTYDAGGNTLAGAGLVTSIAGLTGAIPAGNSVVAWNGSLEKAEPITVFTGTSKTYSATTDREKVYQRSNAGSAMTDTLPSAVTAGNGWSIVISNAGTTLAETLTITSPSGNFPNGTTTFVMNYARRQTFTSDGTNWNFVASANTNLMKIPSTAITAGDFVEFTDSSGATTNRNATQVKTDLGLATVATSGSASDLSTGTLPAGRLPAFTGDVTTSAGSSATTLATVNTVTPGTYGSATATPVITVNGKGLTTASAQTTITPAVGSITGLGTGVATALGTNVGTAGSPVVNGGVLGTPSSGVATNLTGTASGLTAGNVTTNANLTGDVTSSGNATTYNNVVPATKGGAGTVTGILKANGTGTVSAAAAGTDYVTPTGSGAGLSGVVTNVTGTAPIASSGGQTPAISIAAATTSAAGSMSAIDKTTVNNLWYDVTNYGVSTANTGAANVAAMNTLIQTTAPAGARFFFPSTGANYPMTGTITVTKNYQSFIGTGMRSSVIFCANTTVDLFFLQDGVRNITFQDLGFWSTATATAGALIDCGTPSGSGNAQVNIYRCGAESFGGNWWDLFLYNGTLAGLLCNIEDGNFNAFQHYGVGVICNTTTPSSVSANVIANTTFNGNISGTTGAVAGIFVRQCGALQITNSDIIQCTNNLLVAPAASGEIVASIYGDNSYFDSSYGSCIKMAGSGPIVRCKFTSCSFTVAGGANNYSAFEVNSTAANPPAGIDILNCSVQNTFSNSGTSNGLLLTTVADTKIQGNNISGFTNGIQVTPAAAGVTRLNIIGNTIGAAGGIKGNGTGILLNAGSAAYGMIQIVENVFPAASAYGAANTTNITDNSTLGTGSAATGSKTILNNNGTIITAPTANYTATAIPLTTITGVDSRGGLLIPLGARPSSGTIAVYATNAATAQTLTATIRYGTTNTNADAAIYTHAFGAGTAAVGSAHFVIDWEILTSTTIGVTFKAYNGNVTTTTGTFPVASYFESLATPATISTAANNWLGVYFSSATAAAITVRSVKYEVQSQ